MKSRIEEIARDLYRISTFHPDYGIEFNQFVVKDDEPFLMHTGFRKMFTITLDAVAMFMDPARLRWIGFSHFESDECGALNDWLKVAPQAQAVTGFVGANVMINDFADRPAHILSDDGVLEIGRCRLRFLSTPHVPHGWDAGLFFEEVGQALLCSDLFFHPGENEPIIESGIVERARDALVAGKNGPLANDMPYTPYTDKTLQRLAELQPRLLAIMHGSSYRGDGARALLDLQAVIKENLSSPD